MMAVTKAEQETVITYDEDCKTVKIYTFNRTLKRKLERYSKECPFACRLVMYYNYGAVEYEVAKSCIRINFKKSISDKQREALWQYGKRF